MGTDYRIVRPLGTHDWLIILGLSGGGVIRHNTQKISLRPKQLAVFKPEISHDYGTDPGIGYWELIWAHFHAPSDWLPLLSWNEPIPGVLVLDLSRRSAVARRVMGAFLEMYRLASSTLPRRDWLAMNALEGLLLSCDALVSRTRMNLDPRLETVTEHIQRHLSEPHSLHSLAKMAHLSISQLSALFRQQFKVSPRVYIENRRMDHARRLLLFPSLSIKNIAVESGFNDPLYFSKRFRSLSGYSPSDYRKLSVKGRLQDIPCVSEEAP
jgi:AraC family transcriptional regulator of arabinose operon